MRNYTTAPLPFQGQKRNFIKQFKEALTTYPDDAIYIDLFGGSGLLSHTVKQEKPTAKVVYNDYDQFINRLKAIPITNQILEELRPLLKEHVDKSKIPPKVKHKILKIIKKYENDGNYIDYVSLSSNLLFSMNYVASFGELEKQPFYSRVRKSNYNADNYLKGVEIEHLDYKIIFEKYKENPNVVFLVDPPYLSTDCSTYKNYWRLSDYLDVLKTLLNTNYFYFTSNKSSIVELCEWIENNTGGVNPFNQAKVVYHYNPVRNNVGYTDIMLHKKWTTNTTL